MHPNVKEVLIIPYLSNMVYSNTNCAGNETVLTVCGLLHAPYIIQHSGHQTLWCMH